MNQETDTYINLNREKFDEWFKSQLTYSGAVAEELLNKQLLDDN